MSGKLDQSLDQIMTESKASRARKPKPRTRVAATKAKAAVVGPTGGIQKKTAQKGTKAAAAATISIPSNAKESKIIVSNLPQDVDEHQIKDYFSQSVDPVKYVTLTYGSTGRSRGIATICFVKADSAAKAANTLQGVKVDNKPMKIEVVLAPEAPKKRSLADRATMPQAAVNGPKNAAKTKAKPTQAAANGAKKTTRNTKKPGRSNRPQKKTAAELDAEMVDYFGSGSAPAAATAPAGDAMVDEVL